MKFLVLFLVVAVVLWLLKRHHRSSAQPKKPVRESLPAQEMVCCRYCGVYLPRAEALPGEAGFFCDAAHRAQMEKSECRN